jgi:hypothetical protein
VAEHDIWTDPGFWFGATGAVIAILTATREYWHELREAKLGVRRDEIAFLEREVEALKRANELCETRCEELREEMLHLMAQITAQPKRTRRKRVAV